MVVNDASGDECRIAVLQDNHLEELYSERASNATNVGNIYKGRVVNVESAIQAAFVDYGQGQNGFLHISDLHPRYFPGKERTERVGKKIPRRERPPIQEALRPGKEILVQVLKEGIGTKGPTLTSYLSIPGRLLVLMPDMDRVGVSRKVEDDDRRREMRKILDTLDLPEGFGFILRTAGFDTTKTELKRDVAYLTRLWKALDKRVKTVPAPCELYAESDLLGRTIRDVLRPSISTIVVDTESAWKRATNYLRVVTPRSAPKVLLYEGGVPIFHAFDVERQIDLIHSREVPLPSGGHLVIEQTEALVAIDVNSGKSRSARDSETNAFRTNCEAVDEICRQLRLRDLGGVVINDLIDMRASRHRREIEDRFRENLKTDRARTTTLRISDFGILEMTRQRMRPSLRSAHFVTCPSCNGHGDIKSSESVGSDAVRHAWYLLQHKRVRRVEIVCSPRVASILLSGKRRDLVRLEDATGKTIDVRVSDAIATDRVDFYAYDDRNADIDIDRLPAPRRPDMKSLAARAAGLERGLPAVPPEIEDIEDEETADAEADGERAGGRRRGRRGRGRGAAKEAAEAVRTEETGRRKKTRRRGGRGKDAKDAGEKTEARVETKDAKAPAETAAAAAKAETAAARTAASRIYELARELSVPSKEIVQRGLAEGLAIKNHMSSVNGDDAARIRGWFGATTVAAGGDAVDGEDETDGGGRTRRRRRRGRRGGRGRGSADKADRSDKVEPVEPVARAEPLVEDEPVARAEPLVEDEPVAEEPAPEPKETKKKSGRKKRSRKKTALASSATGATSATSASFAPDEKQTPDTTVVADDMDGDAVEDGADEGDGGKKRKKRTRGSRGGRRRRKTKAEGETATASDDATPAPAAAATPSAPVVVAPPRRTLYRSRKPVTVAAREEAVRAMDE
ncbi:MAG: translation initiation factor IF-2 N-terminal domain-containing protein [Planctomycetota bacterium]|jgi:ribonuclease E